MRLLGLTRDNLSASALGIGIALGCGAGAVVVPWLLPLVDDSAAHTHSTAGLEQLTQLHPSSPQQQQPGASVSNDTGGSLGGSVQHGGLASFHTRGYLSLYLHALRTFPSDSLYANWLTVLTTALLLLAVRLLYQWMWSVNILASASECRHAHWFE